MIDGTRSDLQRRVGRTDEHIDELDACRRFRGGDPLLSAFQSSIGRQEDDAALRLNRTRLDGSVGIEVYNAYLWFVG